LGFRLARLNLGCGVPYRISSRIQVSHWTVRRGQQLIGTATWDPGPYRSENLWLSADPDNEEEALFALLAMLAAAYYHADIKCQFSSRTGNNCL